MKTCEIAYLHECCQISLHPLLCISCAFQDVVDRDVCWFLFGCLSMDAVCCVCKTDIEGSWNMICNGNWNDQHCKSSSTPIEEWNKIQGQAIKVGEKHTKQL